MIPRARKIADQPITAYSTFFSSPPTRSVRHGLRFLLYIEVLEIDTQSPWDQAKHDFAQEELEALSCHRNKDFNSCALPMTMMTCNALPAEDLQECRSIVNKLVFVVEELAYRLAGQDIFYRATITCADMLSAFSHIRMSPFSSLVASATEFLSKNNSVGLFIGTEVRKYFSSFPMRRLDRDCHFVFLFQCFQGMKDNGFERFPANEEACECHAEDFVDAISFLKDLHRCLRLQDQLPAYSMLIEPWSLYLGEYQKVVEQLVSVDFDIRALPVFSTHTQEADQELNDLERKS